MDDPTAPTAPTGPTGPPPLDQQSTATKTVSARSSGTRVIQHPATRADRPPALVPGATPASGAIPAPGRPTVAPHDFVLADDPAAWADGQGGTGPLLGLPERDRLPALDAMAASHRALIVIVTKAQEAAVRALAAGARTLFDARVAVVRIDGGPALRSTAALIGQVLTTSPTSPRPVAEIIEWLPRLCDQLGHLVLLGSVNKVDHPAVTVRHHLRSYLPGKRTFVLQTAPEPRIGVLTAKGEFRPSDARFPAVSFDPALGTWVNTLGPRPMPDGLLERMDVHAAPAPMPVTVSPAGYWPDPEATEIVVQPCDIDGWVRGRLPTPETWPCHWCGEPLAAPVRRCPFCADTLP